MIKYIPGISTVLFAIFISGLQYEANDEMAMLAIIFMSNVLFLIGFILIDRALPEKFLIKSKKTLALTLGIVTPIIVTLFFFTFDTEIDMTHLYVLDCVLYCFVVNISFIIQYRNHVRAIQSLEEIN